MSTARTRPPIHGVEDAKQLTLAERWQGAQARASWNAAVEGKNPEVSWEEVDASFDTRSARKHRRSAGHVVD
jgi:hypothetical protein